MAYEVVSKDKKKLCRKPFNTFSLIVNRLYLYGAMFILCLGCHCQLILVIYLKFFNKGSQTKFAAFDMHVSCWVVLAI
jgi:hypothetical protein